ncbi:SRPBCC family protein [Aureimonas altamirensis]|uniref:SRPBCC family protein n=1 Tax=Aureimonas altamirensis TaxID=370622 RepID=UPI003019225D
MIRTILFPTILAFAVMAAPAMAHGPTPQKVDETVVIDAPPEKVWAVMGDFGSIADWNPAVGSATVSNGNERGSHRTLTLPSGTVTEGLDAHRPDSMRYRYRLQGETDALPVSSYTAEMKLEPDGQSTKVTWLGRFYRADTNNDPAEGKTDEDAVRAMTDFIRTGLDGLKRKVEGDG